MSTQAEGNAKTPGPPLPILNAMLIADLAIREEGTGKVSLIGIFENISALKFPCTHSRLFVYVKLTDAKGRYDFVLELIHLDQADKIAEVSLSADVADRMMVGEIVLRLDNVTFNSPGLYEFRLLASGRYVGSKTFNVVELRSTGG